MSKNKTTYITMQKIADGIVIANITLVSVSAILDCQQKKNG